MQTSVISQTSITKGFEREEPWYDHGDFTVRWGSVWVKDRFNGLAVKPFFMGGGRVVCIKAVGDIH
ncbi:hypothetical protein P3644_21110 [Vibrio parahaemolyticus]|uniref:hypothetical protein n=1 Tax=Vibrio parahaemolyticus TaxID=670 RepID=UPI0004715BE7|nr:hypothetical protein [Vibrio parahaemolyticus]EJG0889088.1 hypothetical protein [Vibrio parahaemolyticus]MDF4956233.1 hypothetical protein [Vibrio parahaemolyticus]MDF5251732.1 hypothetical protein [Vibrio parahaemolyticus]MDF5321061.1 hypothetical protein [Vibrio parahaemolyticus]TOE50908.1 hypothetical protein CGJ42_12965 [Vibrio parahaemolyticus]